MDGGTAYVDALRRIPAVVAIDAPLVVTSPVGMRACERAVSRAFGAHGASCHASSRAHPQFDPPRAETLTRRCGWEPVAIEVYPHAAMVEVLYHLETVPELRLEQDVRWRLLRRAAPPHFSLNLAAMFSGIGS